MVYGECVWYTEIVYGTRRVCMVHGECVWYTERVCMVHGEYVWYTEIVYGTRRVCMVHGPFSHVGLQDAHSMINISGKKCCFNKPI